MYYAGTFYHELSVLIFLILLQCEISGPLGLDIVNHQADLYQTLQSSLYCWQEPRHVSVRDLHQAGGDDGGGGDRGPDRHGDDAGLDLHGSGAAHPEGDAQHGDVRQEGVGAALLSRQHDRHRQGEEVPGDVDHLQRGHLGLCRGQREEAGGQPGAGLRVGPRVPEAAPAGDDIPGQTLRVALPHIPRPSAEGGITEVRERES